MQIRILGTRANIKTSKKGHTKHSGLLIDDRFLIDVGEKEFLQYKPEYIFITHLHPDHAYFILTHEKFAPGVHVYTPQPSALIEEFQLFDHPVEIDGYQFTPVPTLHSLKAKSSGILVEKQGKRVFYSADVAWIEKKERQPLQDLNLVITEGSYIRKGGLVKKKDDHIYGHTGIPNLINMFSPHTKRIIFMHLGTWFMNDTTKGMEKIQALQADGLELKIAHDGEQIEV